MTAYDLIEDVLDENKLVTRQLVAIALLEQAEEIYELKEMMYRAINAGDWKVDGACDPDMYLRDFEPRNEEV
jgi:hypothetical protein